MQNTAPEVKRKIAPNPLFHLQIEVRDRFKELLRCSTLSNRLYEGNDEKYNILLDDFSYYILFEGIAEKFRQIQRSHPQSLRSWIIQYRGIKPEDAMGDDEFNCIYQNLSDLFKLDRLFSSAEQKHFSVKELPEFNLPEMDNRVNRHNGYPMPSYQFRRLLDFNILGIGHQQQFILLKNSKHKTNADVIRYYRTLFDLAKQYSKEKNSELRFTYAMNLSILEMRMGHLFILKTAQYCMKHHISARQLTEQQTHLLAGLIGPVKASYYNPESLCRYTPIMCLEKYISFAMNVQEENVRDFSSLRCISYNFVLDQFPKILNFEYTFDDIFEFFFGVATDPKTAPYDIFKLYLDCAEIINSPDVKKLIPIIRELISRLTIDLLPRSKSKQ